MRAARALGYGPLSFATPTVMEHPATAPTVQKIVVLNPKGGSGKSTIATNLAAYYAWKGRNVALMDHDPQGSSMRWLKLRPPELPAIHGIAAYERKMGVTRAFALRTPPGTERLIVDTPAALTSLQMPELTQDAHAIVVPVMPSEIDIHAASRFHAEVPLVAFPDLMHLRIALLVTVLRRGRRRNDRCIHDRAFSHQQALGGQVPVDRFEYPAGQVVLLQQAPELQERRRIRRGFSAQVDAHETPDRLAVVDRVLDPLIGQPKALLRHVHAQHPQQSDRRAPATHTLGVVRLDCRNQLRPRRHRLDLRKETIAARTPLLGRVLKLGETRLHAARPQAELHPIVARHRPKSVVLSCNKSALP